MNRLHMMFSQVTLAVLLSLSCAPFSWAAKESGPVAYTSGADDVPPGQENIHVLDLPQDSRPILASSENKNGLKVVLLRMHPHESIDMLVLVNQAGAIVKGSDCLAPDQSPMTQIMWLNASTFACTSSGHAFSFYSIHSIRRKSDGSCVIESVCHGAIGGRVEFLVKKNSFVMMRGYQTLMTIPFGDQSGRKKSS